MPAHTTKAITALFLDYFAKAEVEKALSLLHDDATWQAMGREGGPPVSGTRNKAGIAELITFAKQSMKEGLSLTPTAWTCEGERVAVEVTSNGDMLDGRNYHNLYHFLFIITEGKIAHIKEYMDTDQARRLFLSPLENCN